MADDPKRLADFPSVPAKAPVHSKAVQFPAPGNIDVIRVEVASVAKCPHCGGEFRVVRAKEEK